MQPLQWAQVSKYQICFIGAATEHSVSICLCLSTALLRGVGDWWPGARPGLPEELRSFLIPLPTSRLRRELPPLSHDSFVTRPKRRHLSGCSLLSCEGRDSVSALWWGRSWAFWSSHAWTSYCREWAAAELHSELGPQQVPRPSRANVLTCVYDAVVLWEHVG